MGPKSRSGGVGSGYLRPDQFLDHLTVIKIQPLQAKFADNGSGNDVEEDNDLIRGCWIEKTGTKF